MARKLIVVLVFFLFSTLFAACGRSQEDEDATATQIAADIFATQTAGAPTETHTPTSTPTFTPTSTPTPTSTATPTPTETPVPTPTVTPVSALALLENGMTLQEEAKSFHSDMELQMSMELEGLSMEIPMSMSADYQAPDRMRVTFNMSFLGFTIEIEMITIGDTVYATNPDTGEWEFSSDPVTPFNVEDFMAMDPAELEDLEFLGIETLDGVEFYHLQGTASGQALGEELGEFEGGLRVDYWIEVESGYPNQVATVGDLTLAGEGASLFGGGEAATVAFEAIITFSDYNIPVVIEAPDIAPETLVMPDVDGLIAFVSERDGNSEIYVMNSDGSNQTNLTNNPSDDENPAWSPDGERISYSSDRDGNSELYVMNADGSEQIRLTSNVVDDFQSTWSPDGERIAFSSVLDVDAANNEPSIYVMNADGTGQQPLTDGATKDFWADWSPDGSRIAVTSNRGDNSEIYVMNADGSGQINLTNNPANDWWPSWSPDSQRITFSSRRDEGNAEIYVMNADGSNQTRLTFDPADDYTSTWSPDGEYIAFASDRAGNVEIYIMKADGTEPVRLTHNLGTDYVPVWSPHGSTAAEKTAAPHISEDLLARVLANGMRVAASPARVAIVSLQ